jgi:transposase
VEALAELDEQAYHERTVVERGFARLEASRDVATGYDMHSRDYRARLVLVARVCHGHDLVQTLP